MFMRARRATIAAHLEAHHDCGHGGNSHRVAEVNGEPSEPAGSGHEAVSIDDTGRSVEVVIETLASVPTELGRLIEGKSAELLAQPAQDGGWGLVEILPHFRDWEVIIGQRVTNILSQDAPALEEYDDSLWAIEHEYSEQDPREAFEEFSALRTALVERLKALEPDAWQRTGILPKRGRVTLHWLLDSVCSHDAKHVVQARDVLA